MRVHQHKQKLSQKFVGKTSVKCSYVCMYIYMFFGHLHTFCGFISLNFFMLSPLFNNNFFQFRI